MKYKRIPLVNPAPRKRGPMGRFMGSRGEFNIYREDIGAGRLRLSPDRDEVWADGMTIGKRVRPAKSVVGTKAQRNNPSRKESPMRIKRNRLGQFVKKARPNPAKKSRSLYKMGKKVAVRMGGRGSKPVSARKLRPTVYSRPGMGIFATTRSAVKGMKINPSRRKVRRNPGIKTAIRSAFSKQMLISAAATVIGYLGGRFIGKKLSTAITMPTAVAPYAGGIIGAIQVLIGGVLASKGRQQAAKAVGIGIAASGVEAIVRQVAPNAFTALEGEGIVPIEAQVPWNLPPLAADDLAVLGAQVPWNLDGDDLAMLGRRSDY